jgi:hypothetical protein
MRADGYQVSLLHGKDMKPEERDRSVYTRRQQAHARSSEEHDDDGEALLVSDMLLCGVASLSLSLSFSV